MPRFSARNAIITLNIFLLTALFWHLKYELLDRSSSTLDLDSEADTATPSWRIATPSRLNENGLDGPRQTTAEEHKKLEWDGGRKRRTAVVVASQASENATWLEEYFPRWERNVYRVDVKDDGAGGKGGLTVPRNKGRESMVYLTYIIDNYENLPDNILFIHPNRYQWHNDDPDYDGLPMLRHFQLPYLESQGYVNIRCAWLLGCPAEIKPYAEAGEHREAVHAGGDYMKAFQHLFPGQEVPKEVGVSCCAQFAATKEKIRERKRTEYERYRQWILDTDLEDSISGRVLEYSWHIIFGKEPVHCPSAQDCYCKVFGLCNLSCTSKGSCEGRYTLPPYSSLPNGWPFIGWEGEARQRAEPES